MSERSLTLYTGEHCHLCEQARQLIYQVITGSDWRLREVNIDRDAQLRERYGSIIPVVSTTAGVEKGWPFTAGQLKRMLSGQ